MIFWVELGSGHIRYANEAACRRLGYAREELTRMTILDIDPDFTPERWAEHRAELKALGSQLFETHHRTKNGDIYPVEVSTNYATFEHVEYSFAYMRDISERKATEQALQRINRALRMLSNSNQMLIRANEETELLEAICRNIVDGGGYRMAWIGLRHDPETRRYIRSPAPGRLTASSSSLANTAPVSRTSASPQSR